MTMPSEAKYNELIAALRRVTKELNAAILDDDETRRARLDLGIDALRHVVLYLASDTEVFRESLTKPLALVENALRDAGQGAAPPLLDHPPQGPGAKPSGTTRENVQGDVAAALEVLATRGGWNTGRAAEWVASAARQLGLRCADGATITANQVSSWRSEIKKKKAPAEACEHFEAFCEFERTKPWWALARSDPRRRTEAERAAKLIIKVLADTAPRAAPRQNRPRENKTGTTTGL